MRPSKAYAWTIVAIAGTLLGWLLLQEQPRLPALPTIAFWAVLLAAIELLPVSLGFHTSMTMGFTVLLAIVMLFPPGVAMLITGIGSIDPREWRRELTLHRALFNRAQSMLAVGAAAIPFSFLEDRFSAIAVIAASLLHLVVNLGLVTLAVRIETNASASEALTALLPPPRTGFVISYVFLASLGAATAYAYDRIEQTGSGGEWAVVAILVPLLFARVSIQSARAQQELSERVREQQHALLQATERVFQEREQERHRIAADLHDSSLQLLAAARRACENARRLLDAGRPNDVRAPIELAGDALNRALTELRGSLMDLRRSTIDGGLMGTIEKYADEVRVLWGADVRVEGGVAVEPPTPVALAAFQICQEGITNALKHASSKEIVVTVGEENGYVHVVVQDQGTGFDATQDKQGHLGMKLMRERAERAGGRIEVDSAPGRGTRLEAVLPAGVSE